MLSSWNKQIFHSVFIIFFSSNQNKIFSADRLVASGGQNQSWPQPHNVQILLSYPPQGIGANVSYVAVVVEQVCFPQLEKC